MSAENHKPYSQVTEADRELAAKVRDNDIASVGYVSHREAAELIADHRAQAVVQGIQLLTCIHHTDVERSACPVCLVTQLRAEVEQLKIQVDAAEDEIGAMREGSEFDEQFYSALKARADKAEADLVALTQCHDDNCRGVVRIAAELIKERARLDWLQEHALAQHSEGISISKLGKHYNGFPCSLRAAIDAAMKGEA